MNKYLEAFGRITLHTEYDNDGSYDSLNFEEDCKLVDEALQRLESIDNANPSEALDYLDRFLNEMTYCLKHPKEYAKGYDKEIFYKYQYTFETTIKQTLLNAEKSLKALEIIKEKRVEMALFNDSKTVEDYNHNRNWGAEELTEEEFELLRSVLE